MSTAQFLRQSNIYNTIISKTTNKKKLINLLKQHKLRNFGSATPYPYLGTITTTHNNNNKDPFLYFASSNCAYDNTSVLESLQYKNTLSSLIEEYEDTSNDDITVMTYSSSSINLSRAAPLAKVANGRLNPEFHHPWSNNIKDIVQEEPIHRRPHPHTPPHTNTSHRNDIYEKQLDKMKRSQDTERERQQNIVNRIVYFLNEKKYNFCAQLISTHCYHVSNPNKNCSTGNPKIILPFHLLSKLLVSLPGKYHQVLYPLLLLYDKEKSPQSNTIDVYRHICNEVGDVSSSTVKPHQLYTQQQHYKDLIEHIYRKVTLLNPNDPIKYELLSTLLTSLLHQTLCYNSKKLYCYTIFHQLQLNRYNAINAQAFLHDLLSHSYSYKSTDVPFCDILYTMVVDKNIIPSTKYMNKLFDAYYPFYDNRNDTMTLLRTMEALCKNNPNYTMDKSVLETISYAAARFADIDMILCVWDLLDMFGYRPSIGLYENALKTFVCGYSKRDHDVLSILTEMEKVDGFIPSRVLVRTVSNGINSSQGRIENAYYLITNQNTSGIDITLANFNVILSACSSMGLIDRAFSIFEDFTKYNIIPNADSFAYLLEAMAVKFYYYENYDNQGSNDSAAVVTQGIENIIHQITMINPSYLSNKYVLHELIRLYTKIDVDKAKKLLQRAHSTTEEQDDGQQGIIKDTFLVLANEYINHGKLEDAKEVLSLLKHSEYIAMPLWSRIKYLEGRQMRK